jgi:hypothetical protein
MASKCKCRSRQARDGEGNKVAFLAYDAAVQRDQRTAAAIERLDGSSLGPQDACGHTCPSMAGSHWRGAWA